jgi:hypothetical protein
MTPEEAAKHIRRAIPFLRRLRRLSRLDSFSNSHDPLRVIAEKLYHREDFREFQREVLELYVAGFLYLNSAQKRPDYQFFREAESKGTNIQESDYTLKYIWPDKKAPPPFDNEDQAAAFIDCLFFIMRYNQSPWADSGKLGYPEYVACLPQLSSETIAEPDTFQAENELRTSYGWHYCPYGEIIFFSYLWRLMLWTSLANSNPRAGMLLWGQNEFIWETISANTESLWDKRWHDPGYSGTYESVLRDWAFDSTVSKFGNPGLVRKGLLHFDSTTSSCSQWEREWSHLLLVARNGKPEGLRPLLRFAAAVSRNCGAGFEAHLTSAQTIQGADRYLRKTAMAWVSACTAGRGFETWKEALNELHSRSRFPILPYFYWNAIDQKPKTHAVIPVWRSWMEPITVPIFPTQQSASKPQLSDALKPSSTSIVGLSVVGLKPMRGDLDSNESDPDRVFLTEEDRHRVAWIGETLQRASLPQVDVHYYFDLQKARERQVTGSLLRSVGHDGSKPAEIIGQVLVNPDLRADLKISAGRAISESLVQRLRGYSTLALDPYSQQQWIEEATERERCPLSQLINASVLPALLRVALSTEFVRLMPAILAENTPESFAVIEENWRAWLMDGKCPEGDLSLRGKDGTVHLQLHHQGSERVFVPITVRSPNARSAIARIYSGLGFLFDELMLNAFRHQYNQIPKAVAQQGIRIRSVTQPEPEGRTWSIRLEFAPLTPSLPLMQTDLSKERSKTLNGLESIDLMLKRLGFEAGRRTKFLLFGGDSIDLPICTDNRDLEQPIRTWEIKKVPDCAFAKERT